MAELAMLADIQITVYPQKVTRQLHVMVQARESSPVVLTTVLRHQLHFTCYTCMLQVLRLTSVCTLTLLLKTTLSKLLNTTDDVSMGARRILCKGSKHRDADQEVWASVIRYFSGVRGEVPVGNDFSAF